jgi:hypothetical protein
MSQSKLINLGKVLHVDIWKHLHPLTKIIIKVTQHIYNKLQDGALVRIWYEEDENLEHVEMYVTTYKSRIVLTPEMVEFVRWSCREEDSKHSCVVRVHRMRTKIPVEVLLHVKREWLDMLEFDYPIDMLQLVAIVQKYVDPESDVTRNILTELGLVDQENQQQATSQS